jgi:hypothetical protein
LKKEYEIGAEIIITIRATKLIIRVNCKCLRFIFAAIAIPPYMQATIATIATRIANIVNAVTFLKCDFREKPSKNFKKEAI